FNIGHNVIARAVLSGLADAVREMRARIREAKA
ncbi:MAG: Pyridoxal phosphate biosynthesis protein PdxJ, partial [Acidobacteriota bacterium]|nr:Pyridoxal phosphate biosynthesis protein PdxJ [Acidobacteriota bacterium]